LCPAGWLNEQSITKHWFQSVRTCPYSWATGRNITINTVCDSNDCTTCFSLSPRAKRAINLPIVCLPVSGVCGSYAQILLVETASFPKNLKTENLSCGTRGVQRSGDARVEYFIVSP